MKSQAGQERRGRPVGDGRTQMGNGCRREWMWGMVKAEMAVGSVGNEKPYCDAQRMMRVIV